MKVLRIIVSISLGFLPTIFSFSLRSTAALQHNTIGLSKLSHVNGQLKSRNYYFQHQNSPSQSVEEASKALEGTGYTNPALQAEEVAAPVPVVVEEKAAPEEKAQQQQQQQQEQGGGGLVALLSERLQRSFLNTDAKTLASVGMLVAIDVAFKKAFAALNITFPASLAGMLVVFGGLVAMDRVNPASADKLYSLVNPGAKYLTLWMPIFFAPNLITLPLAPPVAPSDMLRLLLVTVVGFFCSLTFTAGLVELIPTTAAAKAALAQAPSGSDVAKKAPSGPPFQKKQENSVAKKALALGIASVLLAKAVLLCQSQAIPSGLVGVAAVMQGRLQAAFLLFVTAFGYVKGTRLSATIRKVLHPVLTCTLLSLATIATMGQMVGQPLSAMLNGFMTKQGGLLAVGAGDVLTGMLGPSVVSFACKMFEQRKRLFNNAPKVLGGTIGGAAFGMAFSGVLSRLIGLSTDLSLVTITRQITSPLAVAICGVIGSTSSQAVALVVLGGLMGANFGAKTLNALRVNDPVSRGLAVGASSHGLGTAALAASGNEDEAFAFSAIAMALTATFSTLMISFPPARAFFVSMCKLQIWKGMC